MIWIKRFFLLALLALIVIQFIPVERNQGGYRTLDPFLVETSPSPGVALTLEEACYDCHSAQTDYPWYGYVAPLSFWLQDHIEMGKEHFNMSAWNSYSARKKEHKLAELIEEVKSGEMPLESYALMHVGAHLDEDQIEALVLWAQAARMQYLVTDPPQ
ncbi:heme-binding domain-containing protein [Croceiramulus getboli]|nr:heme-binding domain-containing protein [Flavobacteriaceae bacterium YJPT1-3]